MPGGGSERRQEDEALLKVSEALHPQDPSGGEMDHPAEGEDQENITPGERITGAASQVSLYMHGE